MPDIEALRAFVRLRAAGFFEYCRISEQFTLAEHVIAVKHGGRTDAENLALCCTAAKSWALPGGVEPLSGFGDEWPYESQRAAAPAAFKPRRAVAAILNWYILRPNAVFAFPTHNHRPCHAWCALSIDSSGRAVGEVS